MIEKMKKRQRKAKQETMSKRIRNKRENKYMFI